MLCPMCKTRQIDVEGWTICSHCDHITAEIDDDKYWEGQEMMDYDAEDSDE